LTSYNTNTTKTTGTSHTTTYNTTVSTSHTTSTTKTTTTTYATSHSTISTYQLQLLIIRHVVLHTQLLMPHQRVLQKLIILLDRLRLLIILQLLIIQL